MMLPYPNTSSGSSRTTTKSSSSPLSAGSGSQIGLPPNSVSSSTSSSYQSPTSSSSSSSSSSSYQPDSAYLGGYHMSHHGFSVHPSHSAFGNSSSQIQQTQGLTSSSSSDNGAHPTLAPPPHPSTQLNHHSNHSYNPYHANPYQTQYSAYMAGLQPNDKGKALFK